VRWDRGLGNPPRMSNIFRGSRARTSSVQRFHATSVGSQQSASILSLGALACCSLESKRTGNSNYLIDPLPIHIQECQDLRVTRDRRTLVQRRCLDIESAYERFPGDGPCRWTFKSKFRMMAARRVCFDVYGGTFSLREPLTLLHIGLSLGG